MNKLLDKFRFSSYWECVDCGEKYNSKVGAELHNCEIRRVRRGEGK